MMRTRLSSAAMAASCLLLTSLVCIEAAFAPAHNQRYPFVTRTTTNYSPRSTPTILFSEDKNNRAVSGLKRISADLEGVPIPFVDKSESEGSGNTLKFIECYADSTCIVNGVEYTIAVPCDYSVALCYTSPDDPDQLIPVELTEIALMDDLFPVAEAIVSEEFGEELVLQRTPQTLTLVGELEEDDDDDEECDEEDEEGEEEVEVLLSFEHRGDEFHLVRLLDPILLVGKAPADNDEHGQSSMDTRVLLTPEESDAVMPLLEDIFLKFHNEEYDEDEENDDEYPDDITIVQS